MRIVASLERLGGIMEMGQRVAKGTTVQKKIVTRATYEQIKYKSVAKQT